MIVIRVLAWMFFIAIANGIGFGTEITFSSTSVTILPTGSLTVVPATTLVPLPSSTSVHRASVSNITQVETPAEMVEMVTVMKKSTITIEVSEVLSATITGVTKVPCISMPESAHFTGCIIANDWYPGPRTEKARESTKTPSNHTMKSLAVSGLTNPYKLPVDFLKHYSSAITIHMPANPFSARVIFDLIENYPDFFGTVADFVRKVSTTVSEVFVNTVMHSVPFSGNIDEKLLQKEFRSQQEAIWARQDALRIGHQQDLALRLAGAYTVKAAAENGKESSFVNRAEGQVDAAGGAGA